MKRNPIFVTLLSSVVLTFFVFLIVFFIKITFKININGFTIVLILVAFNAFSFVVLQYVISKFIYSRIRLIYKKIQDSLVEEYDTPNNYLLDNDAFHKVEEDVSVWLESKKEEIKSLKSMANYRKEFLGNVSHELKTPIFNMQGFILTLLDGAMSDKKIRQKYLKKTEKNIDRMIHIVEDLEEISKLEHGELKLDIREYNLADQVYEIIDNLEDKAKKKNISLQISKSLGLETYVSADRKCIHQVFTNLIVNAINYGKDNGEVHIEYYDMDEYVLIEVIDDGIGISKEHLSRLFERFYRVDKSRSTEYGGTGLGLAIVKHIVEAHNQTINVRSTEGKGTTFAFTLKKA